MGSRILFIIKICLIVIVCAAVTGTGVYFGVKYFKNKNDDTNDDTPSPANPIFSTNAYNEAISDNKLITVNYSGTYEFSTVNSVRFNVKSDSNPTGLTQSDINRLYGKYVNEGDYSGFCNYLYNKKKEEVLDNGEYITIVTPTDSNGNIASYGNYTKKTNTTLVSGVIYGDDNLAITVFSDTNKYEFMSLNYNNLTDAVNVSATKNPQQNTIYVYKDVYSSNNPDLLLFTITYEYTLVIKETNIPSKDLIIGEI